MHWMANVQEKSNDDFRAPLPKSFRSELATLYFMYFGVIQVLLSTR